MAKEEVIAIFDVGKTNKKTLLFNRQYKCVFENSTQLPETTDEDGFPCEDVIELRIWAEKAFNKLLHLTEFEIIAMNFSAYGASWVFIDDTGQIIPPLYNYLKPFNHTTLTQFEKRFGDIDTISTITRSPFLGSLNAGLQLFRIKEEQAIKWEQIRHILSLPQFMSWLFTKNAFSEITSIGCHTMLWDFARNAFAKWVHDSDITRRLPVFRNAEDVAGFHEGLQIGTGIHDSSAALIPYLKMIEHPFILLSTGTWNISLNPFSDKTLTTEDLLNDCLFYISCEGNPVRASRIFAGDFHERMTKEIAESFHADPNFYQNIQLDPNWLPATVQQKIQEETPSQMLQLKDWRQFSNANSAYHQLIHDIVLAQTASLKLVLNDEISTIYVDGGFSKNEIFMKMLSQKFPEIKIFASQVPQGSSLGAALALHDCWNSNALPENLIGLMAY